jgi:hypothetical protein
MTTFDWKTFLRDRGIEYIESGRTATRGNIAINCPMCGNDHSFYLSISTEGKGWHCWRNPAHKGSTEYLVAALTHSSIEQAKLVVDSGAALPTDFLFTVHSLLSEDEPANIEVKPREMPTAFRSFTDKNSFVYPYLIYLSQRGIDTFDANQFGLKYCVVGDYAGRIIFPVYYKGELMCWTGRSISPKTALRYKTSSTEDGPPITDYLLWHDQLLEGGRDLVLCEGPFDSLKVNVLGWRFGVRSTCFTTSFPSDEQVNKLQSIIPLFERTIVILDEGMTHNTLRLKAKLATHRIKGVNLITRKDPGELQSRRELFELLG